MMMHKLMQFRTSVLLGLLYISMKTDARAVNVSNTWTMPPEGLNVFYRFFRDRISWFEADAVCQFHHANLVTVDNSFQFDATRDLLRELDVNDIVWIGLMRPQNSGRFMWSNSRPLVGDTGYWAESLPLMESPLCAVIDPIRDYRWHALRCGGPETASFLCEMPVPPWADICIIKDMPNLTMQYMADTASIELIRNCQEEGLLKQSCKTKEDRERAMSELICPKERLEAERINEITNSHFKSLQIINSFPTDNNENNNIDLIPMESHFVSPNIFLEQQVPTEKNTVQKLIEQFNVDELMQGDQPMDLAEEIPKPVKKVAKKVVIDADYSKKEKARRQQEEEAMEKQRAAVLLKERQKQKILSFDDMMMGDQPLNDPDSVDHVVSDENSNEILETLPPENKVYKTLYKGVKEYQQPTKASKITKLYPASSSSTSTTTTTTTTSQPSTVKESSEIPISTSTQSSPATTSFSPLTTTSQSIQSSSSESLEERVSFVDSLTTSTSAPHLSTMGHNDLTLPTATIGHPMHPQQSRSNIFSEETQHPHVKESSDNSHFIPPMLLVKSHYTPNTKHGNAAEHNFNNFHPQHSPPQTNDFHAGGHGHLTTLAHQEVTSPRNDLEKETTATQPKQTTETLNLATTQEPLLTTKIAEEVTTLLSSSSATNLEVATSTPASRESSKLDVKENSTSSVEPKASLVETTSLPAITSSLKPLELESLTESSTNEKLLETSSEEPTKSESLTTTPSIPEEESTKPKQEATNLKSQKPALAKTLVRPQGLLAVPKETTNEKASSQENSKESSEEKTQEPEKKKMASSSEEATNDFTTLASLVASSTQTSTNAPTTTIGKNLEVETKDKATEKPQDEQDETTKASPPSPSPSQPPKEELEATTMKVASELPLMKTTKDLLLATSTTTTTQKPTTSTSTTTTTTTPAPTTTTTTTSTTTTTTTTTTTMAPPSTTTHNFLKDETEAPFKPNRRRSLTKPESASYLKKMLG